MPLERHEWDVVFHLILDDLVGTDNPYEVLRTYFPTEVGHWSITNVASDNARMLVNLARTASLADDDPLPIRLLEVLTGLPTIQVAKPNELTALKQYLARLNADRAALERSDPYLAHVLPGTGQVFIDRRPVRRSLRKMVAPEPDMPEPIVLRVTGDRDVGRSYTYELIRHLATPCGFSHARVILGTSSTAHDILQDLHLQVASEPLPAVTDDDDPVKRLRYWALWVTRQIRSAPDQPWWWLVFDQCEQLDPGSDAVEFIAQLALAVAEMSVPGAGRRPRLVLLGYGDGLADLPVPRKQVEPDSVARVGESDLREFFDAYFSEVQESRQAGVVDETRLAEHVELAVRRVIDDAKEAEQAGECYMRALSSAAEEVVDVYAG